MTGPPMMIRRKETVTKAKTATIGATAIGIASA